MGSPSATWVQFPLLCRAESCSCGAPLGEDQVSGVTLTWGPEAPEALSVPGSAPFQLGTLAFCHSGSVDKMGQTDSLTCRTWNFISDLELKGYMKDQSFHSFSCSVLLLRF